MKTTRALLIAVLGVILMAPALLADTYVDARLNITPRPRQDLEVYVWPDRGMDGIYYPGENIYVNVEVTRDAFLIMYNIDTRGRLHILFPASPYDDNFVRAGDELRFPRSWDDVDWTIDGPAGTEYIQVIASEIPISPPEWPVYLKGGDFDSYYAPSELRNFSAGGDRYAYIDVVNRNICGRYYDWTATDVATFHVRNYPVYHSGYIDPWPDVFYGQIYIGWPIGSRIYIDGVFIGVAPCYIPRHYYGRRIITCYDGPRLIRRHEVNCYPKRDWYRHDRYRGIRDYVYRKARPDVYDHFQIEKSGTGKKKYRVVERQKIGVYKGDDGHDFDDNRSQVSGKRSEGKDDRYMTERNKSQSSAPARIENKKQSAKKDPGFVIKKSPANTPSRSDVKPKAAKRETSSSERVRVNDGKRNANARTADADRGRSKVTAQSQSRKETVVMKQGDGRSRESVTVKKQSTKRAEVARSDNNKGEAKAKVKASAEKRQKAGKGASAKRSKRGD